MKELHVWGASWCPQCKPFKDSLRHNGVEFIERDADAEHQEAFGLNVRSLPTSIILEDGVETKRVVGNNFSRVIEEMA